MRKPQLQAGVFLLLKNYYTKKGTLLYNTTSFTHYLFLL